MQLVIQVLMGFGLAACAGLRAWLPLWILGMLSRTHYLVLHPSFQFLERTDVLVILTVATILELVGDKIAFVDHLLDVSGTVLRPAAGTVLVSSIVTDKPLWTVLLLGIMVGGSVSLSVHSLKALARAHVSALLPFHGGLGNASVSFIEDGISLSGTLLSLWAPILAAPLVVFLGWVAYRTLRALTRGQKGPVASQTDTKDPVPGG